MEHHATDVPVFKLREVEIDKHSPGYEKWGDFRPYRRLFSEARLRSRKKKIAFDLDQEWLKARLAACRGRCEQTGVHLLLPGHGGRTSPWSVTLDRIDSRKGYTKDNVQIVCWSYNVAKATFTDADVMKMARAMVLHQYE